MLVSMFGLSSNKVHFLIVVTCDILITLNDNHVVSTTLTLNEQKGLTIPLLGSRQIKGQ